MLRFISRLFKSIWLFFPGILFLLFPIFCFWMLGQGKDIIIAFVDNNLSKSFFHFYYTRFVFFLVIGFWAYVSWYSSRIISYIKTKQQEKIVSNISGVNARPMDVTGGQDASFYEISSAFLDEFPRVIGNACFLILELAVLQLPILTSPISSTAAWIIFIIALIIIRFINRWIDRTQSAKPSFRKVFWILLILLIVLIVAVSFIGEIDILSLFFLLLLFHVVFIYYTNLRRVEMEKKALAVKIEVEREVKPNRLERTMDFFCVPRKEKGYYNWFLYISMAGIILYIINIVSLYFARHIGPFSTVILAFAVLLAFGNVVTAFSVRSKINVHFILFLLAFLIGGLHETHYVRTNELATGNNNYTGRPQLKDYLSKWLQQRNVLADSSADGYEIYFVMANGGASRSGYWTASVLSNIEDALLNHDKENRGKDTSRFSDHLFCLSGTSGGGVGVATFFSMLRDKSNRRNLYRSSAQAFLKQDYFTYTFARMLGPDFFNYIIPFSARIDRAAALEGSFETSAREKKDTVLDVPFYDNFSTFPALTPGNSVNLPILCINTTRMQDGNPGIVTNLRLDPATFDNRIDVVSLLDSNRDISLTSAAILGARFPYLSPAGRIKNNYFVDGGYFDNSGSGVVQEMIRGIINIGKRDSIVNGSASLLYQQVRKLHFKILHITNSPVILDSNNINKVSPIKNDLLSPVLTIVGAYDMQTTVNDARLINFIHDIDSFTVNKADYTQIPLYEDTSEWKLDTLNKRFQTEPSYAMNWFMSDTTLHRIDKRLSGNPQLNKLINEMITERSAAKTPE
ncbi:MAG: patatin-like phospholipase family protein [Ginsengibacter sp.]